MTTACGFAQNAQISPEEVRSLELTPGVVYITVGFNLVAAIPAPTREGYVIVKPPRPLMWSGSGFLYRPDGYLITNAHVVMYANTKDPLAEQARIDFVLPRLIKKAEEINRRQLTDREEAFIRSSIHITNEVINVTLDNKTTYVGEIKAYSDPTGVNVGKDIAIIKIDANNLPTVPLGNSDDVHVEEPVTVIGYPGAASSEGASLGDEISESSLTVPTVTNGHISAKKTDYKGSTVLQSDAAITHGNSGGPAFDPDGKVIGIATFGAQEAAGFNFFVPINTAMEFVRQAGAPPESGTFDATWHAGLEAMQAHHWTKAHALLGNALEIMPGEPDATRLEVIAAQESQKETPTWVWAGGGAALLILLTALLGWKLMSRQPKQVPVAVRAAPVRLSPHPESATTVLSGQVLAPTVFSGTNEKRYGTLQVTSGPLNGNRFPVPIAGVLIGRDSTKCAIVVSDDSVSKEHAWIVPVDNQVFIIDRNSTNGTYLNSQDSPRVSKTALHNGDRVFIGRKGELTLTYFSS